MEYHILLATEGQSLDHPQNCCQSYQKRGWKARVTIALCDHTEHKAQQSKAELNKEGRGRVLVGSSLPQTSQLLELTSSIL